MGIEDFKIIPLKTCYGTTEFSENSLICKKCSAFKYCSRIKNKKRRKNVKHKR